MTRPGPARSVVHGLAAAGLALVLDELLEEPPARWHPVVLMGTYLRRVGGALPAGPPLRAGALGGVAWAVGAGASLLAGILLGASTRRLPVPVGVALEGAVLWTLLSGRLLRHEVADVEAALARSLPAGRTQVARLVSRDVTGLDEAQVREAALGSLSENLCDSVVAPLLAHAVAGPAGVLLYRWTNTADAMWGYRTERWQHAGRVAARVDDLANLAPARLSGVLLLLVARRADLLPRLPAQARLTPSPNGGWPMGALALLLDVRLAKPGAYALNAGARPPAPADTARALRLVRTASVLAVPVAAAAAVALAATRALVGARS